MSAITTSVKDHKGHGHCGVNFFREEDFQRMTAVMRGENQIHGLTTRGLRKHLPGWKPHKIGRRQRCMRQHGLIKKIAGKYRDDLTKTGAGSLVAARQLTERLIIPSFAAA